MKAAIGPGHHLLPGESQFESPDTCAVRHAGPASHLQLTNLSDRGLRLPLYDRLILVKIVNKDCLLRDLFRHRQQLRVIIEKDRERYRHHEKGQQRQVEF
jgi:hypothetical protein